MFTNIFKDLDYWLMTNQDKYVFENREERHYCSYSFGPIILKRQIHLCHLNKVRVALLDRFLQFEGGKFTPFLVN